MFDFLNYTILPIILFYVLSGLYWYDSKKELKSTKRNNIRKVFEILFVISMVIASILIYKYSGIDGLYFGLVFIMFLITIPAIVDIIIMNSKKGKMIEKTNNKPLLLNTIIVAIAAIICLYLALLKEDILNTIIVIFATIVLCFINNSIYYMIIKKKKNNDL